MHRLIRAAEILLGISLGVIYVLAKIDFFTRYGSTDYAAEHWKYWAAMAVVILLLFVVEGIAKVIGGAREG